MTRPKTVREKRWEQINNNKTMITIKFEQVGRDKKSWTAEVKELSYSALSNQVHRNGAILSRHPEFEISKDGKTGLIFAGLRAVGKFSIVENFSLTE